MFVSPDLLSKNKKQRWGGGSGKKNNKQRKTLKYSPGWLFHLSSFSCLHTHQRDSFLCLSVTLSPLVRLSAFAPALPSARLVFFHYTSLSKLLLIFLGLSKMLLLSGALPGSSPPHRIHVSLICTSLGWASCLLYILYGVSMHTVLFSPSYWNPK